MVLTKSLTISGPSPYCYRSLAGSFSGGVTQRLPPLARRPRYLPTTWFRESYLGSKLPIAIVQEANHYALKWRANIHDLDYGFYLPVFCEGLAETRYPYSRLARMACRDMIQHGRGKLVAILGSMVFGLSKALQTKSFVCIKNALETLQDMCLTDSCVGIALTKYYRYLLVHVNPWVQRRHNVGDDIDHGYDRREVLCDIVDRTLTLMEITGGRKAFAHIKYYIPTYVSAVHNT